ncbi:MAG: GNAT family N-acetyltransferase [Bacteroidota bacterium]
MSTLLSIRKVEKNDETHLAAIIRAVFEEHHAPRCGTVYSDPTTDQLFELFKVEKSILWVAEWNNQIVGCCGIYPTEGLPNSTAELVKFYLLPLARGKKIGKQLIEKSIQSAIELGYEKLYLESMPQFSKAVDFYKRIGFKKLDGALGNSGHTSCSIWMLLPLVNL